MSFISYNTDYVDWILFLILGKLKSGNYINIDSGTSSPPPISKAFYERGWQGIAISKTPETQACYRPLFSREKLVLLERLADSTEKSESALEIPNGIVHFMSASSADELIDALNLPAIRTIRPWVVIHPKGKLPDSAKFQSQCKFFLGQGYQPVFSQSDNTIYIAQEHMMMLEGSLDLNTLWEDQFVSSETIALRIDQRKLQQQLELSQSKQAQLQSVQVELMATSNQLAQLESLLKDPMVPNKTFKQLLHAVYSRLLKRLGLI